MKLIKQTCSGLSGLVFLCLSIATQASGHCQYQANQQTLAQVQWSATPNDTRLDESCWISIKQADLEQVTLIDVRSEHERQRQPLKNVRAIPLYAIEDSAYLKTQPIIVIGSGFDQQRLNRHCIDLRQKGFSQLSLLQGGVRALTATTFAQADHSQSNQISAEQLVSNRHNPNWRIVPLALNHQHLAMLQRSGVTIPIGKASGQTPNSHTVVIYIAADETSTRYFQQQRSEPESLWLSGGMAAYERYITQQQAISANRGQPLVRPCHAVEENK